MDKIFTVGALGAGVICFWGLGALLACVNEARLPLAERTLRMRKTGVLIAALALAWCVPQIQAVAWRGLVPWVWPLAIAAIIASYFFLDNLMARGIAGLFIMGAYSFVHLAFDCRLSIALPGAIMAWIWGTIGIVIAGKPCWLRDFLRLAARYRGVRLAVVIFAVLTAVMLAASALLLGKGAAN